MEMDNNNLNLESLTLSHSKEYSGVKFRGIYLLGDSIRIFYNPDNNKFVELTSLKVPNSDDAINFIPFLDELINTVEYGKGNLIAEVNNTIKKIDNINLKESGKEIFKDLLRDLKEVKFNDNELSAKNEMLESIEMYTDLPVKENDIRAVVEDYLIKMNRLDLDTIMNNIERLAETGRNKRKLYIEIYRYLRAKGFIVRANTLEYYKLDGNGYTHVEESEVHKFLKENVTDFIFEKDLGDNGAKNIFNKETPTFNYVKFKNGIYNLNTMEFREFSPNERPIFTNVEVNYNYNPEAKSVHIKEFLESSLKGSTPEATERNIKGLFELIGYLFTSGNPRQKLICICGISGGGKSVLGNIITEIFSLKMVSDMKFQDTNKDTHATSQLLNKLLNIIKDSDSRPIENVGLVKQLTGYEPLSVNPKGRDAVLLSKEEVPKMILVCNQLPIFKPTDTALIERLVILEFANKIRGTPEEKHNLEELILENPEEIEYLIFNGLEAYKKLVKSEVKGIDFILAVNENETRGLVEKHTKPLNYLMDSLLDKFDPVAFITESKEANNVRDDMNIYYDDLNKVLLHKAKLEGLDLNTNKNGDLDSRVILKSIKEALNLFDEVDFQTDPEREPIYKKYSTKRQSVFGQKKTLYPYLLANNEYWNILEEINNKEKE